MMVITDLNIIRTILLYCESMLNSSEHTSIVFSPLGSDALFVCRAMRREHAERIGDFAARTLREAGINCIITTSPSGRLWAAEVWLAPDEAA